MTLEEFAEWQTAIAEEFAAAQIAAGNWEPEGAVQRAIDANAQMLPNGLSTPRMLILRGITGDGEAIGRVWVGLDHPRGAPNTAFLHDIEVDEQCRGRGLGRDLLAAVESTVRDAGIGALELNVFGGNVTAVHLYESTGYEVTTQQMRKRL
ncbi:MAG TPA: GNAT family N-acetyltransferase [Leifsonia sp.]|nr:GNAT family N-acetyltransferase [Leifsonia sp.]